MIMYNSGYEMWNDMVATYGTWEAAGIVTRYLQTQKNAKYNNNKEEFIFCKELRNARKTAFDI